jgi:hypothetical protein
MLSMAKGKEAANGLGDKGVVLTSEFAAVRVSVDGRANGPRLRVEDLESGDCVFIDPLELASFCQANDEDRATWLLVGAYRQDR